jgi:phenylalanyl-tRNA synthetase beta chain
MKFTLAWLRDHLDTTASLLEIRASLDRIGLEVESISDPADQLRGFVVARVVEAMQHPNADKLRVCMVDYGQVAKGERPLQVVCGAPNARTGLIGVFAPEGTFVPGSGITLVKTKIRGVESNGMMCSERELELSNEHDGIIDLDANRAADIGKSYAAIMGLDDPVIEIKITPNRPDALAIRGIARDLAAAGLGTMKPEPAGYRGKGTFPHPVAIVLEFPKGDESACPAFASRVIRGVKNGPSPEWLQRRLRAIGLRPISMLVDVTNYITFDRGRPLHVYDVKKLTGTLRARLGRDGESFAALDGKAYAVSPNMTVIADDAAVLGFGGIMGGVTSGCSEETTDVLIESAWFDPIRTASTGRATGIHSDARYRFERGVDPQSLPMGVDLATKMIIEMGGGNVSDMTMTGAPLAPRGPIVLRPGRVATLAGLDVSAERCVRILETLGFIVQPSAKKGAEALSVEPPSFRPDVHGEADLVEEIIRIVGIDQVPLAPMPRLAGVAHATLTEAQKRVRGARRILASRGLVEAITWSFITQAQALSFGGGKPELALANPISADLSDMRPSVLPGLLAAAARNLDQGLGDHALFEVGQVYRGAEPADQRMVAGALRVGTATPSGTGRHWRQAAQSTDTFDIKADMAGVLALAGLDINKLQITADAPGWYHPGRSGTVRLGPKLVLGHFGELHPSTLQNFGIAGVACAFEVDLDALPTGRKKPTKAKSAMDVSDLQPVRRDFAFILDAGIAASDVVRAAEGADKSLITSVTVFDLFAGGALGDGRKSLAIEVTLQPREKTLTDEDIEAVAGKVIAHVKKATGGDIRR